MNEKYLFHGTDYDAAQNITVQGFLRDHGRVMAFGRGTYFAKAAATSIGYSPQDSNGYSWMFLCAVILGESCAGSRAYQVPPTKPTSNVHYESMVDSTTNPQIFVISKDYQAYPLFLIKFTTDNSGSIPLLGGPLSVLMSAAHGINNNQKKKKKKKGNKSNNHHNHNNPTMRSKSLIPIKSQQMNANSNSSNDNNSNNNVITNQSPPKKRIVVSGRSTGNISYTQPALSATGTITTASNPFSFVTVNNALPPPTVNNSLIVPTNLPILRPIILPIQSIPSASAYPVSLIPGNPTVSSSSLVPSMASLTSPHQPQPLPPQTTLTTQNSSSSLISNSIVSGLKSVVTAPTQVQGQGQGQSVSVSNISNNNNNYPPPPNPISVNTLNTMLPSLSINSSNSNHNINVNNVNNINNNNNNNGQNKLGGFKLTATPSTSTQIISSNSSIIDPFRQQSPLLSATTPQSSQFNQNIGGPISSSSMITTNSNHSMNNGNHQLQGPHPPHTPHPHTPPTMSPTLQSLPMLPSAPLSNFTLIGNGDLYNS